MSEKSEKTSSTKNSGKEVKKKKFASMKIITMILVIVTFFSVALSFFSYKTVYDYRYLFDDISEFQEELGDRFFITEEEDEEKDRLEERLEEYRREIAPISFFLITLVIVNIIVVFLWMKRAYANFINFSKRKARTTATSAAVMTIIPIVNLFHPFISFKEFIEDLYEEKAGGIKILWGVWWASSVVVRIFSLLITTGTSNLNGVFLTIVDNIFVWWFIFSLVDMLSAFMFYLISAKQKEVYSKSES